MQSSETIVDRDNTKLVIQALVYTALKCRFNVDPNGLLDLDEIQVSRSSKATNAARVASYVSSKLSTKRMWVFVDLLSDAISHCSGGEDYVEYIFDAVLVTDTLMSNDSIHNARGELMILAPEDSE